MRAFAVPSLTIAAVLLALGCDQRLAAEPDIRDRPAAPSGPTLSASRSGDGPVRIEELAGTSPSMFVQRGPAGPHKLVFLHGMCGHAMGYAQSFQFAASRRGRLIAPQADVVCGKGPWAKWSGDVTALDARIASAFEALGHRAPLTDVVAIGYSQGATRAEALARRFPERYTRLVLMGAPSPTYARGLEKLKAALMMAGERDRQDVMKANVRRMTAAGVPSTFMELPEATHGAMGRNPERTMDAALEWLFASSRQVPPSPSATE